MGRKDEPSPSVDAPGWPDAWCPTCWLRLRYWSTDGDYYCEGCDKFMRSGGWVDRDALRRLKALLEDL
jgi:hypothetical protein